MPLACAASSAPAICNASATQFLKLQRPLRQEILERLPLQQFHGDERPALMLADFINGAYIGVVQCRGRAGFLLEARQRLGMVAVFLGQELQRHVALELEVLRPENDTHSAAAQFVKDQVVGDGFAFQIVRSRFRVQADAGGSEEDASTTSTSPTNR